MNESKWHGSKTDIGRPGCHSCTKTIDCRTDPPDRDQYVDSHNLDDFDGAQAGVSGAPRRGVIHPGCEIDRKPHLPVNAASGSETQPEKAYLPCRRQRFSD